MSGKAALPLFGRTAAWQADDAADRCNGRLCEAPLKRFNRHHCRWCGLLFCGQCAPQTRSHQGHLYRCCNACRLPEVFQATLDPITGTHEARVFHTICAFLTPRDVTALLQSCYTMLSTFPVQGPRYYVSLQERFPSLFDGAVIGRGGFGKVFKCEDTCDPARPRVAVKTLLKSQQLSATAWKGVQREWGIHGACSHPGVAQLREVFQTPSTVALVVEAGDGGNLNQVGDRLTAAGVDKEPFVAHVLGQIAMAMQYLYDELGVVHRDIKLDNIVVSADYTRIFLIDLGLAEKACGASPNTFEPVGAAPFASPECLTAALNGTKMAGDGEALLRSDLYSLGIVAYTLLSGYYPFPTSDGEARQLAAQQKGAAFPASRWSGVSLGCTDLLSMLLNPNPVKRPTVAAVLSDPWIRDMTTKMPDFLESHQRLLAEEQLQLADLV